MKKDEKIAIYPGTFDPITLGHMSVVRRALIVFDKLIVAVARDSQKKTFFTYEERYEILKEVFSDVPRVEVAKFEGLLVDFAKKIGVNVIVRGLRTVSDFEYEFQLALANRKLDSSIETVFIMAEDHLSYFSSSLVKEIARLGGDISTLVPLPVLKWMKRKLSRPED